MHSTAANPRIPGVLRATDVTVSSHALTPVELSSLRGIDEQSFFCHGGTSKAGISPSNARNFAPVTLQSANRRTTTLVRSSAPSVSFLTGVVTGLRVVLQPLLSVAVSPSKVTQGCREPVLRVRRSHPFEQSALLVFSRFFTRTNRTRVYSMLC